MQNRQPRQELELAVEVVVEELVAVVLELAAAVEVLVRVVEVVVEELV